MSSSSLALSNYTHSWKGLLLSGITFSGIPMGIAHWEEAKKNLPHFWGHRILAVALCIPVMGGGLAIIERVSVFVYSFFFNPPHTII